jgi:glycosyltransferase involved in cell wall biosynthesis
LGTQRFAFIQMGEFSHTNRHVLEQLRARFPDFEADVIDANELPLIRAIDLPAMVLEVAREFGVSACVGSERLRRHIHKTGHLFNRYRQLLLRRLGRRDYAFTFQTQSLFDASRPGTPHFVYTDHTHLENFRYPDVQAATPVSRSWTALERSVYQNANLVFTMSANISRSLVGEYGCAPEKVQCVLAGSNVSAAASESIDPSRFAGRNILFVGVDWERKGGPVLLEAFRLLRSAYPDARLTIVGCSPAIVEPGVNVIGRVPLAEMAKFYRAASVFCLPTLNEPFGLVFLEAFSYGLPIVATDIGAIPEIVTHGETGYLVTPRDVGGLAARLAGLLDDPQRSERFGAAGRESVLRQYSWQHTGVRMAQHITRAAQIGTRSIPALRPLPAVAAVGLVAV